MNYQYRGINNNISSCKYNKSQRFIGFLIYMLIFKGSHLIYTWDLIKHDGYKRNI